MVDSALPDDGFAFVYVEGDSDARMYPELLAVPEVRVKPAAEGGKAKVVQALRLHRAKGRTGYIGLIDADYRSEERRCRERV